MTDNTIRYASFDPNWGFGTRAIHVGSSPDPTTKAVIPPITLSTTFVLPYPGDEKEFCYTRSNNPTRNGYEQALAGLEKAKWGVAFGSGSAAITAATMLLKSGDHVMSCDDVYGGTNRYFNRVAVDFGLTFTMVDLTDLAKTEAAYQEGKTKMLWIETPTNPMLKLIDLEKIIGWAKTKGLLTVVDNTFATPYFQNPLDFGADLVLHSITKYIGGHSDVCGGCLITNRDDLAKRLHFLQNCTGGIPGPFDCFLAQRGMKTLHVRMEAHQRGAFAVAEWLVKHPMVEKVTYPGFASHPQHELAKKQMKGFGGMLTFVIKGGFTEAKAFLSALRVIALAESLGGVESLAEHPATMTHASVPPDQRRALGIADGLIRVSVGIEDPKDLIADLEQALKTAEAAGKA